MDLRKISPFESLPLCIIVNIIRTSEAAKSRDNGGDLIDINGRSAMMGDVSRCR